VAWWRRGRGRGQSFYQSSFYIAVRVECRHFNCFGDQRESGEDVGEFGFGQTVEVGDQTVEFSAQAGAFDGVSSTFLVRAEAGFFGEVVEFRGGADQAGGA